MIKVDRNKFREREEKRAILFFMKVMMRLLTAMEFFIEVKQKIHTKKYDKYKKNKILAHK